MYDTIYKLDTDNMKKSVTRQITFPTEMDKMISIRLKQLGISAPEYVRQLVIEDLKPLYKDKYFLTEDEERQVEQSMKDLENGDYKVYEDVEDLIKDLHNELPD